MKDYTDSNLPSMPNEYYHIYNRGNNKDDIFFIEDNYRFFLTKYDYYLSEYLTTYAFCLLPNHFHFFVKIKSDTEIMEVAKRDFPSLGDFENQKTPSEIVSERFRRFFMSYSKAVNVQQKREGSLLRKYFRRKLVDDTAYCYHLMAYIHFNPTHHGYCIDFQTYKWSSYTRYLQDRPSKLPKKEVRMMFQTDKEYVEYHLFRLDLKLLEKYIIEE
jgi:putative transposase